MQYAGPGNDLGALLCIRAELDDGVLTVALHRPGHRNLIDVALSREMDVLLRAVHHDPAVRVLVLRGDGPGFSAGLDLQDFEDRARHCESALRAASDSAKHLLVC